MEGLGFTHHEGVGSKSATRHGAEDHVGRNLTGFRREVVVLEAFNSDVVGFHEFRNVIVDDAVFTEGELVVRTLEGVEHGEQVGLSRTAGKRLAAEVNAISATFDSSLVLGHTGTAGIMAVDTEFDLVAEELTGALEGFINLGRVRGTGSILEADGGERNTCVQDAAEDAAENAFVEFRVVGGVEVASRRKFHHGHDDFVFQTGVGDALTGVNEVVDVVQGVEVTNTGHAVLLEHVGMELDHIARLRSEGHHVNTAGEGLQADVRTHHAAEFVHHVECVFAAVLVQGLETGAATSFKVGDAGLDGSFDSGHEVLSEDTSTENRLETIAERGILELDLFHSVFLWDKSLVFLLYNKIRGKFRKTGQGTAA